MAGASKMLDHGSVALLEPLPHGVNKARAAPPVLGLPERVTTVTTKANKAAMANSDPCPTCPATRSTSSIRKTNISSRINSRVNNRTSLASYPGTFINHSKQTDFIHSH